MFILFKVFHYHHFVPFFISSVQFHLQLFHSHSWLARNRNTPYQSQLNISFTYNENSIAILHELLPMFLFYGVTTFLLPFFGMNAFILLTNEAEKSSNVSCWFAQRSRIFPAISLASFTLEVFKQKHSTSSTEAIALRTIPENKLRSNSLQKSKCA